MHLIRSLFAAMLVTIASGTHAFETVASPGEARAITDQIMAKVGANELDAAAQLRPDPHECFRTRESSAEEGTP